MGNTEFRRGVIIVVRQASHVKWKGVFKRSRKGEEDIGGRESRSPESLESKRQLVEWPWN